jgi:hypothetical protein
MSVESSDRFKIGSEAIDKAREEIRQALKKSNITFERIAGVIDGGLESEFPRDRLGFAKLAGQYLEMEPPQKQQVSHDFAATRLDLALQAAHLVLTGQPTPGQPPPGSNSPGVTGSTPGESPQNDEMKKDVNDGNNMGKPSSLHNGSYANMEQKQ